ncbi:MAG: gamma-glutamylcyclotransferase family protein [Clostridium sp.]|uniref:gamma-glutamylcyclotransferase family protein n=1 Tax=Clostridium sp. TaxID=1506 RepID=UPI003EE5C1BD
MLKKVFVYGSLRENMFNYDRLLKGKVEKVEEGKIKGELFHIENKGYPAVIKGDEWIIGELMTIKDFEKNLEILDHLEGYVDGDENCEYLREIVKIILSNDEVEEAYFYRYNREAKRNKNDVLVKVSGNDWKEYMNEYKKVI